MSPFEYTMGGLSVFCGIQMVLSYTRKNGPALLMWGLLMVALSR